MAERKRRMNTFKALKRINARERRKQQNREDEREKREITFNALKRINARRRMEQKKRMG